MLKIVAAVVFIYCLISLIYSAYLCISRALISGRQKLTELEVTKNSLKIPANLYEKLKGLNRSHIKSFILDSITLNSKQKKRLIIYALPISFILSIPSSFIQLNKYTTLIGFLCVLIALLGIGKYLGRNFKDHLVDKFIDYYIKVSIFIAYSLGFFIGYLENSNNNMFFVISLISTVIYSVYILKSIIDGFENIGFCVINFLLIYLYDLLTIGLHFGFFYLQNNDIFRLYSDIKMYESFNLNTILSIIQTGLSSFYTLSSTVLGLNSWMNFVPLLEYVFGAVFNVGILGFFISYITSKIFAKQNNNVST
ncbi:MAG: hypothetical protein WCR27_02090 [Eubacteriales bacterium]